MKKEVINVDNVSFSYDKKKFFLNDLNLKVYEKDFIGIIGPNGGGKTTLLKLILGLLKPDKGKISIFEKPVKKGRKEVGYLSQFKNIDFDFPITAYEIVLLSRIGNSFFKKYCDVDKEFAKKSMKSLNIWSLKDKKLNELSGGEKQRVFVARALANNPKLLLLDEPMSNLDIHIQEEFYKILKDLNKKIAIVVVDHDIDMVSKYAKKIVCVNKCNEHALKYHESKSLKKRGVYYA